MIAAHGISASVQERILHRRSEVFRGDIAAHFPPTTLRGHRLPDICRFYTKEIKHVFSIQKYIFMFNFMND